MQSFSSAKCQLHLVLAHVTYKLTLGASECTKKLLVFFMIIEHKLSLYLQHLFKGTSPKVYMD